jgi:cephalosporin hydroxylase
VKLDAPASGKQTFLELDFSVPVELAPAAGAVTLVGKVNGVEVGRKKYTEEGRRVFVAAVPAAALGGRPALVEFSVDKSGTDAGRPVGVIVVSVGLKEFEETVEFRDAQLKLAQEGYARVLAARNLKMPVEKQREMMRLFHDLPAWENQWFLGVRIIKNPLDLWMLQQIAYELQPEFVIETGTWRGGSALWWAHTLNGMGLEGSRVLTVDIQDLTKEGASAHPLWKEYVEFQLGSSTDPAIVAKIAARVRNKRTLVNLDSDHSMQHVLRELRLYGPLVSPGSYMAVEDTHLDGIPTHPEQGAGPTAAIRAFLAEGIGLEFEQDFTREALVMTSYPGGWLRRKR